MSESVEFIKNRAVKTISAANQVAADWVWPEKSPAEMQTQLHGIIGDTDATPPVVGQEEIVATAQQTMLGSRIAWDAGLDQLHLWTTQGLGMARIKYRNQPLQFAKLDGLTAVGSSREETLAEALEWQTAWKKLDPSWAPLPANTLVAFEALRDQCAGDLKTHYAAKQSDLRDETNTLAALARDMEDINEAWYADVCRVFVAGTPHGDMIRSTIPTTYTPPTAKPPVPPVG
ncbi:MAG: hypothetical protein ABIT76_05970 [Chthoniobacterales bacterium]